MKYFKYTAYDKSGEIYTGVDQHPRFEYLAIKLIQQDLHIKEIVAINYEEYQLTLPANSRLQKLNETRDKLSSQLNRTNELSNHVETKKISPLPLFVESAIIFIILFIIAAIIMVHNKI